MDCNLVVLKKEEYHSFNRNNETRKIRYNLKLSIEFYLAELLFVAETTLSQKVLSEILNPTYSDDFTKSMHGRNDLYDFCLKIPKFSILKLDEIISKSNDDAHNEILIRNFWQLWEYFFEKIKESKKSHFINTLLLGIDWNKEMRWRKERNKSLSPANRFPIRKWPGK